jgi:alpha-tubulin suppressor-like RCC1 family protein
VSFGGDFCLALKSNGTLWSWGRNDVGQLGQNIASTVSVSSPVQIGALTNWSTITSNTVHGCAITTSGTLFSWGRNQAGQLGSNTILNRSSPVQVGALTDWSSVSCGGYFTTAVKTNGTLWSWGLNQSGELGINLAAPTGANRSSPVQVGALTDWSIVVSGSYHTASIKTNGTLWTWGSNIGGQIGDNTVDNKSSPVQVGALSDWYDASSGQRFVVALYGVV